MSITPRSPDLSARGKVKTWVTSQWKFTPLPGQLSAEINNLIDLRKGGCLKLGVSTEITGAKCFDEAQQFSDMLYKNPLIDGILYASRLTGENCLAVFDRAAATHLSATDAVPVVQLKRTAEAMQTLNIKLIQ
jgi:hypothetical protein